MFQSKKKLVNLGCGCVYHSEWHNFDIHPQDKTIHIIDLTQELPFDSASIDVIYASHILEHLTRIQAKKFLCECKRTLRLGGILRLVVPDLEAIVRLYLKNLEEAIDGNIDAQHRYRWMTLELFDQMVRTQSGGEMLDFWHQDLFLEEKFIRNRMGEEYDKFLQVFQLLSLEEQAVQRKKNQENLIKNDGKVSNDFLQSGERHCWMYDRYSLSLSLKEQGFEEIMIYQALQSRIPYFTDYHLDTDAAGKVRKPDSLFIEAIKLSE